VTTRDRLPAATNCGCWLAALAFSLACWGFVGWLVWAAVVRIRAEGWS
jgi:hypothetical protein